MINRNEQPAKKTATNQGDKPRRWATYSLMAFCIMLLAGGFFFAAQQHFSSMDYGMKNSRLRKHIDDLEAEKRRLILAREISLSPAEIKKAVKRAGLFERTGDDQLAQMASTTRNKEAPMSAPPAKPVVIKTASVSPVAPAVAASFAADIKSTKPPKKARPAE